MVRGCPQLNLAFRRERESTIGIKEFLFFNFKNMGETSKGIDFEKMRQSGTDEQVKKLNIRDRGLKAKRGVYENTTRSKADRELPSKLATNENIRARQANIIHADAITENLRRAEEALVEVNYKEVRSETAPGEYRQAAAEVAKARSLRDDSYKE